MEALRVFVGRKMKKITLEELMRKLPSHISVIDSTYKNASTKALFVGIL